MREFEMGESQHSLLLDLNKRNWLVLAKLRRKGGKRNTSIAFWALFGSNLEVILVERKGCYTETGVGC